MGWRIFEEKAGLIEKRGVPEFEAAYQALQELGVVLINGFYGPYKMENQMPNRYWSTKQLRFLADLPLEELEANFGTYPWCVVYPKTNHKLPELWDQLMK